MASVKSPAVSFRQSMRNQNIQITPRTAAPISLESDDVGDTPMEDVADREDSPTTTDNEENMSSEENFTDEEAEVDEQMDLETGDVPGRLDFFHMGKSIAHEFPDPVEYEDDEAKDMFDDGLEDDESSESDSDDSSNYEELTEPDTLTRVVEVSGSESKKESDVGELMDNEPEDAWNSAISSDEDEKSTTPRSETASPIPIDSAKSSPPKSFAELQEHRLDLMHCNHTALLTKTMSLEEDCDIVRWRILALEETKRHIELELAKELVVLEKKCENKRVAEEAFAASLEKSEMSRELYEAYNSFCASLEPEFGQRDGWSITCSENDESDYFKYDPDFVLFKQSIEMPYTSCNFRCESGREGEGEEEEDVVMFWPIKSPEPLTGTEVTWGDQYPELYDLAYDAIRSGSEAAMEMLVNLPDRNSRFDGGWIFEYEYKEILQDNPIQGKMYQYRSAQKIDSPCTGEQKKARLELALRPENVM